MIMNDELGRTGMIMAYLRYYTSIWPEGLWDT